MTTALHAHLRRAAERHEHLLDQRGRVHLSPDCFRVSGAFQECTAEALVSDLGSMEVSYCLACADALDSTIRALRMVYFRVDEILDLAVRGSRWRTYRGYSPPARGLLHALDELARSEGPDDLGVARALDEVEALRELLGLGRSVPRTALVAIEDPAMRGAARAFNAAMLGEEVVANQLYATPAHVLGLIPTQLSARIPTVRLETPLTRAQSGLLAQIYDPGADLAAQVEAAVAAAV